MKTVFHNSVEVWRRFLWKAVILVKSLWIAWRKLTFGKGKRNTFSSAWPFNYIDDVCAQCKCYSVKGHNRYLASLAWCPLSFLSYIPVLPVKTSLTNCSSSCWWMSRESSAPRCHSSPSALVAQSAGLFFWHCTNSLKRHTEIFGAVKALYPGI